MLDSYLLFNFRSIGRLQKKVFFVYFLNRCVFREELSEEVDMKCLTA